MRGVNKGCTDLVKLEWKSIVSEKALLLENLLFYPSSRCHSFQFSVKYALDLLGFRT